jgi:hypothetical protein
MEEAGRANSSHVYEPHRYEPKDPSWNYERVRRRNRRAQFFDWKLVPTVKLVLELSLVAFALIHVYARDLSIFMLTCGCILIWNAGVHAAMVQQHLLRKHFAVTWAALMVSASRSRVAGARG